VLRFETELDVPLPPTEPDQGPSAPNPRRASLLTFADAGAEQGRYRVWLRAPGVALASPREGASLLLDGEESRSRNGNVPGSINDDDPANLVNTYTGERADEDWFAVTLEQSVLAARFVFVHGRSYHDGGWFDTRQGAPQVQIRRAPDAAWDRIGTLSDYPATTAAEPGLLKAGQAFTLQLDAPVRFVAVRVWGRPSSGDRPEQSFVSCAELQAFVR
jgi:hypothetical protein